ncbi:hypothetical protein B484DRAFT_427513 [Ochromonadaceae sp. CCMP2298]|nr:hypothetical protein B484DRAFT_427513 [Ochromonadaceae sp. CCMP2298]
MTSSASYKKLSTADNPFLESLERGRVASEDDDDLTNVVAVRNDKPFPISRPPPQVRDWPYAVAFLLHFGAILLLSFIEHGSLRHSLLNYERASSWASMLMIVTLLGSCTGALVVFLLGLSSVRETLMASVIPFSLVLKVCLGNILLIMRSEYSFLGVLVILSAVVDSFWSRAARQSAGFSSALVQMAIDTTRLYGVLLGVTVGVIVAVQTCILLWWGAFFVGLISTYSVGLTSRLALYLQCALTTSLGSICKGALLTPPAEVVLTLHHWVTRRQGGGPVSACSLRGAASCLLSRPLISAAEKHHRLTLSLLALYGRAFCPTALSHLEAHPETLDITTEDCTRFLLDCAAVVAASVLAIVFGLVAEREGASWPLFFFVCFYLAYCGVSLAVQAYSSAVDALIVASAINPIRFAHENQIVFLRFLRTSEQELR